MNTEGLIEGDKCNRNGCAGIMEAVDADTSCSCHINPPCSHCVDMEYECNKCGFLVESPNHEPASKSDPHKPNKSGWYLRKTPEELFAELKEKWDGKSIDYVDKTPRDNYYFMIKKGLYPEGTTKEDIKSLFNLCFGYAYLNMENGVFEIKYYTD